jgi:hypothetical protein
MPNVNDLKKYFNKDSFQAGDTVEFMDGGQISMVDFSREKDGSKKKEVLQFEVSINGCDPKAFTINGTSMRELSSSWGPVTEKWKGKKAKVEFIKMQVFGKIEEVLLLTAVNGKKKVEEVQSSSPTEKEWDG